MDNLFPSINTSNIYDYQEYYLIKEHSVYKLLIGNLKNAIFIKCKHYYKIFGLKEISNLFQKSFDSLSAAYQKLENLFEEEKIIIKNILPYKKMKLILNIDEEEVFELTLNEIVIIKIIYNKTQSHLTNIINNNDIHHP